MLSERRTTTATLTVPGIALARCASTPAASPRQDPVSSRANYLDRAEHRAPHNERARRRSTPLAAERFHPRFHVKHREQLRRRSERASRCPSVPPSRIDDAPPRPISSRFHVKHGNRQHYRCTVRTHRGRRRGLAKPPRAVRPRGASPLTHRARAGDRFAGHVSSRGAHAAPLSRLGMTRAREGVPSRRRQWSIAARDHRACGGRRAELRPRRGADSPRYNVHLVSHETRPPWWGSGSGEHAPPRCNDLVTARTRRRRCLQAQRLAVYV